MNDSAVVTALSAIGETRAAETAMRRLEEFAAPAEFAAAVAMADHLSAEAQRVLRKSIVGQSVRKAEVQAYVRRALAPDVLVYSAADGSASDRTLVVGLTGATGRLAAPVGIVLQSLPARHHDFVLLRDAAGAHFDLGVSGYANSLPTLAHRLGADLGIARYRRVVTLGTSMGGLPALRLGVVLPADLSISVGGRPIWHVHRLLNRGRRDISAFDLLCPCGPAGPDLWCIYAARNAEDREGPELLQRIRPVRQFAVPFREHNVLHAIVKAGHADRFLPALIAGDGAVVQDVLSRLV